MLGGGAKDKEHAMSQKLESAIAVVGIDIGKNSFHVVGHDARGAIVLRQKWSRGQVEARLANIPPCLIGIIGALDTVNSLYEEPFFSCRQGGGSPPPAATGIPSPPCGKRAASSRSAFASSSHWLM